MKNSPDRLPPGRAAAPKTEREKKKNGSRKHDFLAGIEAGLKFAGALFLDLCLPGICAGCGKLGSTAQGSWCRQCLDKIPRIASPLCPRCGRPFTDSPLSPDHLCGECSLLAFNFDSARSAVLHSGVVRDRVHQLKFGGRMEWLPPLVELLEIAYADWGLGPPDMVLPVPLHPRRLKERGFNQSGLLAKEFSRKRGLPISFDLLLRKNWTEPQTGLKRKQRLKNLKGAFAVREAHPVRGLRILLIDDVFTTGATLNECAKTLKRHGASEVHALTVTRALPD